MRYPKRVYLVGQSNGGFMSYRMACEHADAVAAIVSLAGATFVEPDDCRPTEPVAVLQIHGSADDVIAYDGGELPDVVDASGAALRYPGARATATAWAGYDGCESELVETDEIVDVDALIEARPGRRRRPSRGPRAASPAVTSSCGRSLKAVISRACPTRSPNESSTSCSTTRSRSRRGEPRYDPR